jgi:hypothetical protein
MSFSVNRFLVTAWIFLVGQRLSTATREDIPVLRPWRRVEDRPINTSVTIFTVS